VGYQQYRPSGDKKMFNNPKEGRYFTFRKDRVVGVWGLESWNFTNTLFITEGIFDAARLTALGVSAVATLSNDLDPPTARWMWAVRKFRRVVAVCDNDAAGRKLAKYGTVAHTMSEGKDLGDASQEEVNQLVAAYTWH
jgi:5S rRNA maturation endonuclease (ribonuclease M5)